MTVGSDQAIWFCEVLADKIGRITTAGTITEYGLPPGTGPVGLSTGPDGAIWFTGLKANVVGRMTLDGAVTMYDVPTAKSGPYHITLGPDKALWFTEIQGNKIGRLVLAPEQVPSRPTTGGGLPIALPNTGGLEHWQVPMLVAIASLLIGVGSVMMPRRLQ